MSSSGRVCSLIAPPPLSVVLPREATAIPAQAPVLAIRAKFLEAKSLDKVVVVSTDVIAQILAKTASSVTRHDILFFPLYEVAVTYLQSDRPDR